MNVVARRRIHDSPLADLPPVPRGTRGYLDDEIPIDGLVVVEFPYPWGHVLCDPNEVTHPRKAGRR